VLLPQLFSTLRCHGGGKQGRIILRPLRANCLDIRIGLQVFHQFGEVHRRGASDNEVLLIRTPLQRTLCTADSGNGISAELDLRIHLFINPDLTVVLAREPRGEWVGMRSCTALAGEGTGLARSQLFDVDGPVGSSAQTLLVDRR
jgi:hypothetical protein